MQPGYSTASDEQREMGFGAGMGLPNMKKNADDIAIDSAPGRGTRVHMRFALGAGG
jgi:anti-sigma regulatory factor (Ser/Thr protein kinase)